MRLWILLNFSLGWLSLTPLGWGQESRFHTGLLTAARQGWEFQFPTSLRPVSPSGQGVGKGNIITVLLIPQSRRSTVGRGRAAHFHMVGVGAKASQLVSLLTMAEVVVGNECLALCWVFLDITLTSLQPELSGKSRFPVGLFLKYVV